MGKSHYILTLYLTMPLLHMKKLRLRVTLCSSYEAETQFELFACYREEETFLTLNEQDCGRV